MPIITGHDDCLKIIRQRSPLMLHVVLEQIHRARHMTLADDLRMERNSGAPLFYTEHLGRIGAQQRNRRRHPRSG